MCLNHDNNDCRSISVTKLGEVCDGLSSCEALSNDDVQWAQKKCLHYEIKEKKMHE